jgi:hypothetical protein
MDLSTRFPDDETTRCAGRSTSRSSAGLSDLSDEENVTEPSTAITSRFTRR